MPKRCIIVQQVCHLVQEQAHQRNEQMRVGTWNLDQEEALMKSLQDHNNWRKRFESLQENLHLIQRDLRVDALLGIRLTRVDIIEVVVRMILLLIQKEGGDIVMSIEIQRNTIDMDGQGQDLIGHPLMGRDLDCLLLFLPRVFLQAKYHEVMNSKERKHFHSQQGEEIQDLFLPSRHFRRWIE